MATMSFSSIVAAHSPKPELCASIGLQKSPFLSGSTIFKAPPPQLTTRVAGRRTSGRCYAEKSRLNNIPKRFREENLKDGLAENFKNVPEFLYGLTPKQMNMFTTEDSPIHRQSQKVTEESISSKRAYGEMTGYSAMMGGERVSMMSSASMYQSGFGGGGGQRGPKSSPPDLPSLILDSRIVYLGLPIVPAVAELIVAQFIWLAYENDSKPIYLYINSTGTLNEEDQIVGSENDAYAIIDAMSLCSTDIYTVNIGCAYGQAAMLLAHGKKGKRGVQPRSLTKLYKPKGYKSSGAAIDTWIQAKELDVVSDYYLELLSEGIGKPKDEISRDIDIGKFFTAKKAIEYGIADRIMKPVDEAFERKDYDEQLATSKPMQQRRPGNSPVVGAQPGW